MTKFYQQRTFAVPHPSPIWFSYQRLIVACQCLIKASHVCQSHSLPDPSHVIMLISFERLLEAGKRLARLILTQQHLTAVAKHLARPFGCDMFAHGQYLLLLTDRD